MKLSIETQIIINASPSKVWKIFTDFENYEWNPFIKSLKGSLKEGEIINLELSTMKFKSQVLIFKENTELRWLGSLLFKRVFDGEHYFKLSENQDGSTTFIHGENFSGILVRPFKNKLLNETRADFIKMNKSLKEKVERNL